jgi:hypothetical protein
LTTESTKSTEKNLLFVQVNAVIQKLLRSFSSKWIVTWLAFFVLFVLSVVKVERANGEFLSIQT